MTLVSALPSCHPPYQLTRCPLLSDHPFLGLNCTHLHLGDRCRAVSGRWQGKVRAAACERDLYLLAPASGSGWALGLPYLWQPFSPQLRQVCGQIQRIVIEQASISKIYHQLQGQPWLHWALEKENYRKTMYGFQMVSDFPRSQNMAITRL